MPFTFLALDNKSVGVRESQFASPLAPTDILRATRRGWPRRPGPVPRKDALSCVKAQPVARGRAARRGLQFPECPAATGGAGERPQPIKGSSGVAGERQVEPGRGWARGQVPRTRPEPRWGRGANWAGSREAAPGTGPSGGGDRGRLRGSGCSRRAQPGAHLTGDGLRGRAGLGRTPERRGVLQPLLLAAAGATA